MRARRDGVAFGVAFGSQLLEPEDWFAFWRLNCVLASYHAQIAGGDGYEMEDKLAFLEKCEAAPAPPRLTRTLTLTLTLTKVRGGGPPPIALAQAASQAHLQAPQRGQG